MKCLLSVCLAGSIVTAVAVHSAVLQLSMDARAMQKGVRVEMASANHARPWPQADDTDAWVVTVDGSGRLYFGTDPVSPEGLRQWMIRHPRRREQRLYIKADARASYASVEKALNAANAAEFAAPVLLVNQPDPSAVPGKVIPPKGLEVHIEGGTPSTPAIVVEIDGSPSEPATLKINHELISWDSLQERLGTVIRSGGEKMVFVKADGR